MRGAARRRGRWGSVLIALALPLAGCGAPREAAPLGRLAFVRGDTLYVQALPGGKPRRLLTGGRFAQPRWSPSGEWIAFHAGDGLRVARANGAGGQKLAGPEAGDFAWAPGDDRLAYVAEGNLIVARPGGIAVVLVEKAPGAAVEGIAWSADGQRIAYGLAPGPGPTAAPAAHPAPTATPPLPPTPGARPAGSSAGQAAGSRPSSGNGGSPDAPDARVRVVPSRGGAWTAVRSLPGGGMPLVRGWSGANVLVLLAAGDLRRGSEAALGGPLYAVPAGRGAARLLADSVLPYPDFVAPRPGGAAVAIVRGGGPESWRGKALVLGTGEAAAPATVSGTGRAALSPAWSPSGTRLAWVEMPDAPLSGAVDANLSLTGRRVLVADVDPAGRVSRPRPAGGPAVRQEYPRWAADARHLLIIAIDSAGAASTWLLEEGRGGQQIVAGLRPPAGAGDWSGAFGHVSWDALLDYWRGANRRSGR